MRERVLFLDGLRALAVLSVVAYHAVAHEPRLAAASPTLTLLLRQGCHGVDLFFILSGFCLSYPFLSRADREGSVCFNTASFAARRMLRILPPYYGAIALFLLLAGILSVARVPLPAGMPQSGFTAWDVVRQVLFFDANVRLLNDVFWTLAVEFRWYFVFPVALWLWLRSPRAFIAVAAVAMLASVATRAQSVDLAVLPTFMLGIVAAQLWIRGDSTFRFVAPLALSISLPAAFATSQTHWFTWSADPLWGIAMFWLVVTVGLWPMARAMFSLRILTLIGFTSYGIYLVHEPLRGIFERSMQSHLTGWPLWALSVALAVVAGMAFSWIIEIPFLKAPLRENVIAHLQPALVKYFKLFGLSDRFTLPADAPHRERGVRAAA